MNAEKFWFTWLKVTTIIVIIVGISIAFFSQTHLYSTLNKEINLLLFADYPPEMVKHMSKSWLVGLMGLVLAIFGISILLLTIYSLQKKELWALRCIFTVLIIWFLIDTSVSIYYNAIFNVIINIIFFLQIAAPLLYLKKSLSSVSP